jgi:hypothetical protein
MEGSRYRMASAAGMINPIWIVCKRSEGIFDLAGIVA